MKTKSKLVLGLSILTAATMAAATTSTFAWYQAGGAAIGNGTQTATSALTVNDQTVTFGNLKMNIAVNSEFSGQDDLVVTDRAGKTYYVVGNNVTEILTSDDGSTCGDGHKQGKTRFDIEIQAFNNDNTPAQVDLTADMLAAAAQNKDTYTVSVTADGSVKVALVQTTSLGTGNGGASAMNPASDSAKFAGGALGAALSQSVAVLKIQIADDGTVSYWTNAADGFTGDATGTGSITTVSGHKAMQLTSAYVYYGLEVNEYTGVASPSLRGNDKLTPSMAASDSSN